MLRGGDFTKIRKLHATRSSSLGRKVVDRGGYAYLMEDCCPPKTTALSHWSIEREKGREKRRGASGVMECMLFETARPIAIARYSARLPIYPRKARHSQTHASRPLGRFLLGLRLETAQPKVVFMIQTMNYRPWKDREKTDQGMPSSANKMPASKLHTKLAPRGAQSYTI